MIVAGYLATKQPSPSPASESWGSGQHEKVLARRLRLVITSGELLAPFEVDPGTVVGRGDGPFAMLLDQSHNKGVSRRHCQVTRTPAGDWTITDLAGKGSTWVSADAAFAAGPMTPNGALPVEAGRDQVRVGLLTFRVEAIQ